MKIFIIGSGTFGTAISNILSFNINNKVVLYCRNIDKVNEINLTHTNKKYFPNKKLNSNLKASNEFSCISEADVVFIALPSSSIKYVVENFKQYISSSQLVVNLSKGIYEDRKTIVSFLRDVLKTDNVVSLKGPSFAIEIMENADTLLTLGFSDNKHVSIIKSIFSKTNIHFDYTNDINGVENLSVIKNIYAVLIGIIDAKFNSPNTRFMFMTKVFSEIRVLNKEFHGDFDTLFLSCGFGDLCLTSLNDLSRNRTLGLLIGKGFYNTSYRHNTLVVEGLNTINVIFSSIDSTLLDSLPLLKSLHSFFNSDRTSFIVDFKDFFKH